MFVILLINSLSLNQIPCSAIEKPDAVHATPELEASNPPAPVQMLVPGFSVDKLPLQLTNLNNLRYRDDGKLIALGYDGNIWLASDSDGDGREDQVVQFFSNQAALRGPIGMAVIPDGHHLLTSRTSANPDLCWGVVVASKGKVSAIIDDDGDDQADQEQVIASGWKEIPQNVDAVGIAFDQQGSIYFGLGTAAYNNAYLLDEEGRSRFDLASERGTIQRISADLSQRETICTGIRFPIGMDFDAHGELFVTDQEGATWLPNGNPFDELLHIRRHKHYGFPPRHPRYLPQVFDQPSTFDYAPQHQSTCGMAFNRPAPGGDKIFGPETWRDDLFVCGESRGKLYRTRLLRDQQGNYTADNSLIACLSMLTVDCCVTPRGDLLVACHSGGPDWGTGPSGPGTIFRIRYSDPSAPQPVRCYPRSSTELAVDFDRPLDSTWLAELQKRAAISYGDFVTAGDRFESIRPGYAVTQMQMQAPRHDLPIHSVSVTPDLKTLLFSTDAMLFATSYALRLDALQAREPENPHASTELSYRLNGIQTQWTASNTESQSEWTELLPHPNREIYAPLLVKSQVERLNAALQIPGQWHLRLQIDTKGWLKPAIQPGSELDYPPELDDYIQAASLVIENPAPFSIVYRTQRYASQLASHGGQHVELPLPIDETPLLPLEIIVPTGPEAIPDLRLTWTVALQNGQMESGLVPLSRCVLPWAKPASQPAEEEPSASELNRSREIPELAGGNWGRGRREFFHEETGCGKCHRVSGEGANIGPDLSNLVHRDYTSVLRDIQQPSYALNPDFLTQQVLTKDGRLLVGVLSGQGQELQLADTTGKIHPLPSVDIENIKPSPLSVMPVGLLEKLGPQRTADLMTFLLLPPPRMPNDGPLSPPAPRSRDEVRDLLSGSESVAATNLEHRNILLVAGTKDHGPGEHDYPAWLQAWSQLLPAADKISVDTAMNWPSAEQFAAADCIVFYQKGSWDAQRSAQIDGYLNNGGGLVFIHWAIEGGEQAPEFAKRIGLASNSALTKYRHGPLDLQFDTPATHPISRNLNKVHFYDESYWNLVGDRNRINVLAHAVEAGQQRPQYWILPQGGGRVFVSIPGHYSWSFDDPVFRVLLFRGISWSMNDPIDRLNPLATMGMQLR
ncbi:MAG: ThuA domain-containing protein [bacterium]|nr:ThuA domain-containing protein [bacterium]